MIKMNVGDFRKKYLISLNYSADWALCDKYADKEVETFSVCMNSHAFVFKGARAYFCYLDGFRMPIGKVIEYIESAQLVREDVPEKLRRYILLNSV